MKHSYLVKEADDLPRIMKEAFYLAQTGRTGPVVIELPVDIQQQEIGGFLYPERVALRGYTPPILEDHFQIKRAASLLSRAKQPVLCVGAGVILGKAVEAVRAFAEKYNFPVLSTLMGIDIFPTSHPLNFGLLGGEGETRKLALEHCDLLLMLGESIEPYLALPELKYLQNLLSIDVVDAFHSTADVIALVGEMSEILGQMEEELKRTDSIPQRLLQTLQHQRQEELLQQYSTQGIHPINFFRILSQKMREDAVLCVDSGIHRDYSSEHIYFKEKTRFLCSGGLGTKGYALPCAIGAKLAAPKRQTFVLCGDGGFQRSFLELSAIVAENLDIKIVVFQNHVIGHCYQAQQQKKGHSYRAELLGSPDFLTLAHAYGMPAGRITQESEIEIALQYFLEEKGTQILVVETAKDVSLRPKLPPEQIRTVPQTDSVPVDISIVPLPVPQTESPTEPILLVNPVEDIVILPVEKENETKETNGISREEEGNS